MKLNCSFLPKNKDSTFSTATTNRDDRIIVLSSSSKTNILLLILLEKAFRYLLAKARKTSINKNFGKDIFNEEIQEERNDKDEGKNIVENNRVMQMMKKMGYEKGKGLGRQSEGAPSFGLDYEIRTQKHKQGIGYRSTTLDDIREREIRIAKSRAEKEDVPFEFPMRPYPLSLNGQFARAGDNFPFWGFRDQLIVATGWDM